LAVGRWRLAGIHLKHMFMSNYKNLDVWKLSIEAVKEVYTLTRSYPPDERFGLISQTNRAAVSIPSNIAEGFGRNHKKDTIQFLFISRGSAYEVETLLNIALSVKIINEESYNKATNMLERVLRVINGYINYLERKS
jgi:four helix bundle protein